MLIGKKAQNKKMVEDKLGKKLTKAEYEKHIRDEKRAQRREENKKKGITTPAVECNIPNAEILPYDIRRAYSRGDFDEMRFWLQKVAYEMVGKRHTKKEKQLFKETMIAFAREDPLIDEVMERLYPIIKNQEGILQSKIYSYIPTHEVETIRYVLYFAHELMYIIRIKKGNSYALYTYEHLKDASKEIEIKE
jgi:hypothetical protein